MSTSHRKEMGSLKLAVDKLPSLGTADPGKEDESQLGGVGHAGGHAFAEKSLSKMDTIETSRQYAEVVDTLFRQLPHLHARREAESVHRRISLYDVLAKPGALHLISAVYLRAHPYYSLESSIKRAFVFPAVDQCLEGMAYVNLLGEYHEAVDRAIPSGQVAILERKPGEKALGISQN